MRRRTAIARNPPFSSVQSSDPSEVAITVSGTVGVSGLLQRPRAPRACLVLAHGAGAGMHHPFMAAIADEFAAHGIATLRFQFPYMEKRARRPDPPALCHATIRAAVAAAHELLPQIPLLAGGKSFGGRMSSQAQAKKPLERVRGLVFLGFPLHPAGRPGDARGAHLSDVAVPMLFFQGTRDTLAEPTLLRSLVERLGERTTLILLMNADHSFHVPARSGTTDADIRAQIADALIAWLPLVL